jgi:hypothetical protein
MSDPPYVSLDLVCFSHRSYDAFCLLFYFTSLGLLCSTVDIACVSPFLSFLQILLGCVVNMTLYRPSCLRERASIDPWSDHLHEGQERAPPSTTANLP